MDHVTADKMVPGRWYFTEGPTQVVGVCAKCGDVVPAITLTLKRLPFGRGEQYECQGCQ